MKKYIIKRYIIKHAEGSEQSEMQNSYKSRNEASDALMEYIYTHNKDLSINDDDFISPFDFILEEVECEDVNEVITDFESAKKVLSDESNSKVSIEIRDVIELVTDVNPKHIDALIALNKLFTIAEAWNKEDEFVPDFSNYKQNKWFPLFRYDKDSAKFVYVNADGVTRTANGSIGSRLCFKTIKRAEQFGGQFVDLYNEAFL